MALFRAASNPRNKSAVIALRTRPWKAFSANQQFLRPVIYLTIILRGRAGYEVIYNQRGP